MTRRYVLVKLVSERPVTRDQLASVIASSVRTIFGEIGFCRIEPNVILYDLDKQEAILACRREAATDLQAALALIAPPESPLTILTVRLSGTIKGLRQAMQS